MDNLSAHKPASKARELIESRGSELIYLPAYSLDFNPIEAFAEIKGMLHRAGARTKDALIDTLDGAISALSTQDAQGYFQHAD